MIAVDRQSALISRWRRARELVRSAIESSESHFEDDVLWSFAPAWRRQLADAWRFGDLEFQFDNDIRILGDLSDHIESQAFLYGMQEGDRGLVRFLRRWWEKHSDATFVDVGANIGLYSLMAGSRLVRGRVYAFEPVKALFQRFSDNLVRNNLPNITAYNIALSDRKGKAAVWIPIHNNKGMSSLYRRCEDDVSEVCDVVTLDNWMLIAGVEKIDLLKIDVEGAEMAVLKGGLRTLVEHHPIIAVELSAEHLARSGHSVKDVCNLLRALDYRSYLIGNNGKLSVNRTDEWGAHQNAIFIYSDSVSGSGDI